jgi:hypothetical protein
MTAAGEGRHFLVLLRMSPLGTLRHGTPLASLQFLGSRRTVCAAGQRLASPPRTRRSAHLGEDAAHLRVGERPERLRAEHCPSRQYSRQFVRRLANRDDVKLTERPVDIFDGDANLPGHLFETISTWPSLETAVCSTAAPSFLIAARERAFRRLRRTAHG